MYVVSTLCGEKPRTAAEPATFQVRRKRRSLTTTHAHRASGESSTTGLDRILRRKKKRRILPGARVCYRKACKRAGGTHEESPARAKTKKGTRPNTRYEVQIRSVLGFDCLLSRDVLEDGSACPTALSLPLSLSRVNYFWLRRLIKETSERDGVTRRSKTVLPALRRTKTRPLKLNSG